MWDSIVFVNRGVTIHHPKLYISFSPAWISACIPNHWRAPVSFMNSDPSMRGYALSRWRTLRSSPRLAPYNSQSQSMYGERYVLISLHKGRCVQRYPSVQGIWGQTSWYDFHPEPVLHQDTVPCFFFFWIDPYTFRRLLKRTFFSYVVGTHFTVILEHELQRDPV